MAPIVTEFLLAPCRQGCAAQSSFGQASSAM